MDKPLLDQLEKKLKGVKIEGFIIHQKDQQIFEYLKNKKVKEKPFKVYSITKTVVALLIGILVDKGIVQSIDTPIYTYFPQLLRTDDEAKKKITIHHLLTMTKGLKVVEMQGTKNWVEQVLEQPVQYTPGTTFQYSSGDSHLLSAIIHQVSGMPTAKFAEENLFGPLGIKGYSWVTDPQGIHGGGFSLLLKLQDLTRIGFLILKEGIHNSKPVLSSDWISKMQYPYKDTKTEEKGTYGYGYQLWTYKSSHPDNPIDFCYASGIYGQNIFIVPQLEMVAVGKSQLKSDDQSLPRQYFIEFLQELENSIASK
jgi:CubicO group peptidase (beta-lactamase class C family)